MNYDTPPGSRIIILLISGKRKSGKDFVAEKIRERLGKNVSIILRISAPLKAEYAKIHSLEYKKLLDSSTYKENYRSSMVKWGEEKRMSDPSYFCKQLLPEGFQSEKSIWIISDIRRKTDIDFFDQFKIIKLRIWAEEETRRNRGWNFMKGIDDSETENNLDSYKKWDFIIENNGDTSTLETSIEKICNRLIMDLKNYGD